MSISSLPHMHFHQAPATRETISGSTFSLLQTNTPPPRHGVLNFNYHVKQQIPKNSSRLLRKPRTKKDFFYHLNRGNSVIKFKNRASAGPERGRPPPPRGAALPGASRPEAGRGATAPAGREAGPGSGRGENETPARLGEKERKRKRKGTEERLARSEYHKVPRGSGRPLSFRLVTAAGFLLPQVPGGAALGNIPTPSPAPSKPGPSPTPTFPRAPHCSASLRSLRRGRREPPPASLPPPPLL